MELIIYPIAIAYFIWLHIRDKRVASQTEPVQIEGTVSLERDSDGNIKTIRVNLT